MITNALRSFNFLNDSTTVQFDYFDVLSEGSALGNFVNSTKLVTEGLRFKNRSSSCIFLVVLFLRAPFFPSNSRMFKPNCPSSKSRDGRRKENADSSVSSRQLSAKILCVLGYQQYQRNCERFRTRLVRECQHLLE